MLLNTETISELISRHSSKLRRPHRFYAGRLVAHLFHAHVVGSTAAVCCSYFYPTSYLAPCGMASRLIRSSYYRVPRKTRRGEFGKSPWLGAQRALVTRANFRPRTNNGRGCAVAVLSDHCPHFDTERGARKLRSASR
ncbi:hypothetical protein OBBRIDRAFT_478807 [Obba rivulosa]|uniref:Uncharacterized protein n=1 Tax=Obba rivulosa TaxID=1052685 RepID=A0A8E2AWT5_9APHY|nr:hypothetical protein OBBRIDRAFT_478807 [Obba rivulosa]